MKTKLIYAAFFLMLVAAMSFLACSKSNSYGSANNTPATASVSIKNMAFGPVSLSVSTGTTVTWTNNDTTSHTVTADDGSFNSGIIAMGGKYSRFFPRREPSPTIAHCIRK